MGCAQHHSQHLAGDPQPLQAHQMCHMMYVFQWAFDQMLVIMWRLTASSDTT